MNDHEAIAAMAAVVNEFAEDAARKAENVRADFRSMIRLNPAAAAECERQMSRIDEAVAGLRDVARLYTVACLDTEETPTA